MHGDDMDLKEIKKIVDDFSGWQGDSYRLAVLVYQTTLEAIILKLIESGHEDVAVELREG